MGRYKFLLIFIKCLRIAGLSRSAFPSSSAFLPDSGLLIPIHGKQREMKKLPLFALSALALAVSTSGPAAAVPPTLQDDVLAGEEFTGETIIAPETGSITIASGSGGAEISGFSFSRPNESVWNSQFIRTLNEICSFSSEPPYVSFLNFGKTLITREPIGDILRRGVWPSLLLMIPIFLGELVLGIILALLATAAKDTFIDRLILAGSISLMSISYLVVIIFAQWSLGYYYNFFPVWGWGGVEYLALPVLIGIVCGLGGSVRFYRSVFVNELNKEYLRTAAAKGCSPLIVYNKHLLRNALIPIITRAASVLPFLFTGSLLLESFFGIPGLGYAGLDAIYNSDLQLLKALVIVSALLFVLINLITDIAYAWADPRIRLK